VSDQHTVPESPAGRVYPRTGQDWAAWLHETAQGRRAGGRRPVVVDADAVWVALMHLARQQGFTVERGHCADAEGFSTWRDRRIRIRPDATSARAVAALAHQLGHVLLHGEVARLERSGTVPCSGIRKIEADSVAWLVSAHLGMGEPWPGFPPVASWAGSDPRARPAATVDDVTARVLAAAAAVGEFLDSADVAGAHAAVARGGGREQLDQRTGMLVSVADVAQANEAAAGFFRQHVAASWVPDYLAGRGLSPAVQRQWGAGYASAAWDALTRHLRAAGYSDTVIEAAGLAYRSQTGTLIDFFGGPLGNRVMLPIRSPDGTIIAFIGRAADRAVRSGSATKYLNSPATVLAPASLASGPAARL
jgi:DNA primase